MLARKISYRVSSTSTEVEATDFCGAEGSSGPGEDGKVGMEEAPFLPYILAKWNIIFHQPRFPWNKGISLTKPPFGVRSCEVARIWPDI